MAQVVPYTVVVPGKRSIAWHLNTGWQRGLLLAAWAILVTLVTLTYLVETGDVAAAGYTIQRLQAEREDWRLRNQQLKLELDRFHSLAWVEYQAVTKLKMQKPGRVVYLRTELPNLAQQQPHGGSGAAYTSAVSGGQESHASGQLRSQP